MENIKNWFEEYISQYISIPISILKGIKVLAYSLFIFLDINIDVFNILFWLIVIDMGTGVGKTIAIKEYKFKFRTLYSGIMAKLIIILIPCVVALVLKAFTEDYDLFLNGVMKLIILTEGISIITNCMSVYKRENFQNPDYLYLLMKTIRDYFDRKFQQILKK